MPWAMMDFWEVFCTFGKRKFYKSSSFVLLSPAILVSSFFFSYVEAFDSFTLRWTEELITKEVDPDDRALSGALATGKLP